MYEYWTHVKEIASTGLLVSVHHCYDHSASLEVFDVSRKGQAKKIYSFEEVSGGRIIVKIYLIIVTPFFSDWFWRSYL